MEGVGVQWEERSAGVVSMTLVENPLCKPGTCHETVKRSLRMTLFLWCWEQSKIWSHLKLWQFILYRLNRCIMVCREKNWDFLRNYDQMVRLNVCVHFTNVVEIHVKIKNYTSHLNTFSSVKPLNEFKSICTNIFQDGSPTAWHSVTLNMIILHYMLSTEHCYIWLFNNTNWPMWFLMSAISLMLQVSTKILTPWYFFVMVHQPAVNMSKYSVEYYPWWQYCKKHPVWSLITA